MLVLIRHLIQFDFGHENAINLNTERKGFEFANAHLLIKWCFSIRWISCLSVSTVKYLYKGHYWSVLSWLLMKYWNCVLIRSRLFWCEVILSKCVFSAANSHRTCSFKQWRWAPYSNGRAGRHCAVFETPGWQRRCRISGLHFLSLLSRDLSVSLWYLSS